MIYLYYLNTEYIYYIKHCISHILAFTATYDFLCYLPFKDKDINIFYGTVTLIY